MFIVKIILFIRINRRWTEKKNALLKYEKEQGHDGQVEWLRKHSFDVVDVFYISCWTEKDYVSDGYIWYAVNSYWDNYY